MYRQNDIRNRRAVVLPEPDQLGVMIVRGVTAFSRRNPIISGGYVLGILILFFFSTGYQLSNTQAREYNRIMDTVDVQAEYDASQNYWHARNAYEATRGWFWSCDSLCQRNKKRMEVAESRLQSVRQEGAKRMSKAKNVAGLFSEVGMGEVKDSFWEYFHQGKQFAKRQSSWDVMFIAFRSMTRGREESWIEFGLRVLMQILLNFSLGLIMALIFFIIGLWSIVRSYQPDPLTAVIFFVGAVLAAASFVVTYLVGIYGAAATGVYALAKVAESSTQARLEEQRRQARMGYNQRPHYD